MRHLPILLLLFLSASGFTQQAEQSSKMFIEMNLARYAEVPGLFKNSNAEAKFDFVNGFKLGFKKDEKTETYISLMKYSSSFEMHHGFSGEKYSSTGYQIGLGWNKRLFQINRISGQIGGEILFQFSKSTGQYWIDYNPFNLTIDGIELYEPGIASLLQLNYKISELISISANTRFGAYYRFKSSNDDFRSDFYSNVLFEPLNSFALRVNLK